MMLRLVLITANQWPKAKMSHQLVTSREGAPLIARVWFHCIKKINFSATCNAPLRSSHIASTHLNTLCHNCFCWDKATVLSTLGGRDWYYPSTSSCLINAASQQISDLLRALTITTLRYGTSGGIASLLKGVERDSRMVSSRDQGSSGRQLVDNLALTPRELLALLQRTAADLQRSHIHPLGRIVRPQC